MHILIIEDEIPAFEKLELSLSSFLVSGYTYDWARSVEEIRQLLIETNKYDLILSDIQLLDGLSFSAFEATETTTPIIFCSAYDEYLLEAFSSNGIAYILKPYHQEDIIKAFEKYHRLFDKDKNLPIAPGVFDQLKAAFLTANTNFKERFVIKSKKGIQLLASKNIALIEAKGDFCRLVDNKGVAFLYSENIGGIFQKLNPDLFFRINRSQVVQLSYIESIENHFKNRLLLTISGSRDKVMTSSSTTANFRTWLDR